MSLVFVGDPHATAAELGDVQALIDGICELPYQTVVFLGDQFHTHSVLNLEVIAFWKRAVYKMKNAGKEVWMLVGNHDMATSGKGANALITIEDALSRPMDSRIIDKPKIIADGIVAIPYCHTHEEFDAAQRKAYDLVKVWREPMFGKPGDDPSSWTLVCHQTFAGAQYENGFYAPDGFPLEHLLFKRVISGHIHAAAEIVGENGLRIKYVGSPRWRIESDAGQRKFLLAYPQGIRGVLQMHDTSKWCRPIEVIDDTDDSFNALEARRWENSKLTVVVKGEPDRVRRRCAELQAIGVASRPRPTATAAPRVSEGTPIAKSFQGFLRGFKTPYGTAGDRLVELANDCYPQWVAT